MRSLSRFLIVALIGNSLATPIPSPQRNEDPPEAAVGVRSTTNEIPVYQLIGEVALATGGLWGARKLWKQWQQRRQGAALDRASQQTGANPQPTPETPERITPPATTQPNPWNSPPPLGIQWRRPEGFENAAQLLQHVRETSKARGDWHAYPWIQDCAKWREQVSIVPIHASEASATNRRTAGCQLLRAKRSQIHRWSLLCVVPESHHQSRALTVGGALQHDRIMETYLQAVESCADSYFNYLNTHSSIPDWPRPETEIARAKSRGVLRQKSGDNGDEERRQNEGRPKGDEPLKFAKEKVGDLKNGWKQLGSTKINFNLAAVAAAASNAMKSVSKPARVLKPVL
ncbi:MAG: hypothetical protein M1823_005231 [Watsoniomyces obsoletus]|nr:MAG: hypothetical protein M1823_005231 [Watsoniomyces obsoletus]